MDTQLDSCCSVNQLGWNAMAVEASSRRTQAQRRNESAESHLDAAAESIVERTPGADPTARGNRRVNSA
jgi:hypothetical protein